MNDAQQYAEAIADELAAIEDSRDEDGNEYDTPYEAVQAWAEGAVLDMRVTRVAPGGHVDRVEITRTIGGPGCWLDARGDGTVRIEAAWGSDRGGITVDAPTVDAWAWDLAELVPMQ